MTRGFLAYGLLQPSMAKSKTADIRVRAKETVDIGDLKVTNKTANSITVRATRGGLVVTNCCLEEQGI